MRHSNEYHADLKRFPSRQGWVFHHFHYRHLKRRGSIYLIDGCYIPKWLHVPFVHRVLGGGDRAGSQRFGKFPNPAQRCAHWIFRLFFSLSWAIGWLSPIAIGVGIYLLLIARIAPAGPIWWEMAAIAVLLLLLVDRR